MPFLLEGMSDNFEIVLKIWTKMPMDGKLIETELYLRNLFITSPFRFAMVNDHHKIFINPMQCISIILIQKSLIFSI